jgi:phosphate starvation-inducible PhoH-like protein
MPLSRDRAGNRQKRKEGRRKDHAALLEATLHEEQARRAPRRKLVIEPLNQKQREYDISMRVNTLTFGIGPAGTGKTWLAAARAAEELRDGVVERLIITRPALEAGEELGFLPGELEEKYGPYFRPVRDALVEVLGAGAVDYHLKAGTIEARPLAYMRGATFKFARVLLDEAQNTTASQMKMFLTRLGEGSKIVVNGDPAQSDLPKGVQSGLTDSMDRLIGRVPSSAAIFFERTDIVRSGFVQDVLDAYHDNFEGKQLSWL